MEHVYYLIDKMKYLVLLVFLVGLGGCSKNESAPISQDKMVNLLYDLTVSTSARSVANKQDSVQYVVSYEAILKKHGVDSLSFVNAQAYYQDNPEVFSVVYDSVQKRIKKKLDETRALPPDKSEEIKGRAFKILKSIAITTEEKQ